MFFLENLNFLSSFMFFYFFDFIIKKGNLRYIGVILDSIDFKIDLSEIDLLLFFMVVIVILFFLGDGF
jgi:hypothetical protein